MSVLIGIVAFCVAVLSGVAAEMFQVDVVVIETFAVLDDEPVIFAVVGYVELQLSGSGIYFCK